MRTVNGGKKSPNRLQGHRGRMLNKQRNGLLAIVHIAKQDLGLDDDTYRDVLANWGVKSSAAMSVQELSELVGHFCSLGFRVCSKSNTRNQGQADALHARIRQEAARLDNGDARLAGLIKAKAGVDDLRFCRDVEKLKQILRILKIFQDEPREIYD